MIDRILVLICRVFHRRRYAGGNSEECAVCFRRYAVAWASRVEPNAYSRERAS